MESFDEFPEGWGLDGLSDFQHKAFVNELCSFANDTNFTQLLTDLDSLIYESLLKTWPKQSEEANLGTLLMINSHNHFRGAARLCLSGQCLPVYPTARACLETAVYGWFLIMHPEKVSEWLNKPASKDEIKKWNQTFGFAGLAKRLGQVDSDFERLLKQLHQVAIDFGAHPNRSGLVSNMSNHPEDKSLHRISYMHSDGNLLHHTFNFMFDIALCMLMLIKLAYKRLDNDVVFSTRAEELVSRVDEQHHLFKRKLDSGK